MNPPDILPFSLEEYGICGYCSVTLETETELLNRVCYKCQFEDDQQTKLEAFDELAYVSAKILRMSDIVSEDIRPMYRCAWLEVTKQLCHALHTSY